MRQAKQIQSNNDKCISKSQLRNTESTRKLESANHPHLREEQSELLQNSKKRRVQFADPPVEFPFFGTAQPCMPKLVALMVLENLNGKGIYATSQVNSIWNSAAMDDALWED
jgi:hypothetical protein